MTSNANHQAYQIFAGQRQEMAGLLGRSSQVIARLNMDKYQENLDVLQGKVHNDSFKIMVVGTFKNGKSTFINSFLGDEVLPAYSIPCTAVINEVKYGEEKRAILHFRNPLPEVLPQELSPRALEHMQAHQMQNVPPLEIPYDEIEDYVVIPMGMDASEMLLESPYEKVELFWPLELLKNGVEIIDSPGLNEHATRTRVTMDYLSRADAILMVLNAQALCSESEMDFVIHDLKGQGFDDPFFVVNRFDCIPRREQEMVKKFAQMKLKNYTSFGASGIHFVSALDALDGKMEGDPAKFEASGMMEFEQRLSRFLTGQKGKMKLAQPARELKRILNAEALFKVIPMQRKMLSTDLNEMKLRYEQVKPLLQDLTARKDQLESKMALRIEQCKQDLRRTARRNILDLSDQVTAWIEEYEPKNQFGLIPNKEKTEVIVKEISEYITEKVEEHQRAWRKDVLTPLIEEKSAAVFESAEADAAAILAEVDEIQMNLSDGAYQADPVPTWQRIVGAAGGLLMGDVGLAASAGINGLSMELAKTAAIELGAGALLGVLGLFNPFTICAMLVGVFLFNMNKSQSNAMKKLKAGLTENLVGRLAEEAEKSADEVSEKVTEKFNEIAQAVVSGLDAEIGNVNAQMKIIIAEMEQGKENMARREQVIGRCEEEIKALSIQLDELIFDLVKG